MRMNRLPVASLVLLAGALGMTGCAFPFTTLTGPGLGIPIAVPVSPYFQDQQEDEFWVRERYSRVPILGPITAGGPPVALDPPSDDEVMRALERADSVEGGVPLLFERQRNRVRIVPELIAEYVDPPRVYPLIGPAQLHHAHYKCTIYFEEVTRVGWPVPYTTRDEDSRQVVYIDHNHLHMVEADPNLPTGPCPTPTP